MGRLSVPVMVLLLMLPVAAGTASAAVAAPQAGASRALRAPGDTGKYYVVGPPVNGHQEYLFAIAATTLGNGNRYKEIFELNKGRPQPGGQTMTDSTRVQPGWILVLPQDAKGPGVRSGPPPAPGGPATGPSSAPAPVGSSAAPSRSAAADWNAGALAEPPPPDAPGVSSPGIAVLWSPTALRVALLVLAVLLVAWAQMARMARRRAAAEATARSPAYPGAPPATGPAASASLPPSPPAPAAPVAATAARPPASAPPDPFATLVTDLRCGEEPAKVRLIGARPAGWAPAYGWLDGDQRPPASTVPVIAGERDGRRLWLDLAMAPDVLTVGGGAEAARRHAVALVTQLGQDTDVVVAGDALGDDVPSRFRRIASLTDLATDAPTSLRVVVCRGTDGQDLRTLLGTMSDGPHRTVPIVVGGGPAARWSISLGPDLPA
ncbi:hypothetical protein [Actinoplanes sp. NBRC 103695]|uniref:hypothetical protein n=1 Tax=Actinoplanes sp. NBRC 103695 TaxID=3032202 RepID=UPI0024A36F28|nr:hypothetical protein [Actinoplanes sp. NBRC 103695]GLZ01989.1 hypothetical protein Acsp02_92400 [Actinoplanes sp. NBRC 103695]